MATLRAVKTRLILLATLCLSGFAAAEPAPDAQEILRTVRLAQASQHQTLRGQLRNGGNAIPFRLVIDGPTIRYQFNEPPTLQLRLLDKDSRLEEITRGSAEKVTAAKFDTHVRNTDITYEDLALKFLYWPNATVEGDEMMLLRKCWKIRVSPPAKNQSQYSSATLWIEKESGALMQAEALDHDGKFAKRFKVISGQKLEGMWLLKQMRIETGGSGGSKDRTPTYLEIGAIEKSEQ